MEIQPASYASFFRRFGAVVLDMLILLIPGIVAGSILPVIGGALVWFFYAPFLESSALKATIGKNLMGIQVGTIEGQRLSFGSAFLREIMKLVSGCCLFLPHFLALFTERKQAMHDLVVGSVVTNGRAEIPVVDAWWDNVREVFGSLGFSVPQAKASGSGDRLGDLERLQSLFERGALTKEEFEAEKARLLAGE
ncbi:MAG: hypothetical protein EOP11_16095 [Proteobacteria bacterium]|nr:MAG: hypothetical protein EOP11_16095 [Pseudomonadota bacterium]